MQHATTLRIWLVRHGESTANVNPAVHHTLPDIAIPLTGQGQRQAHNAGQYLSKYYNQPPIQAELQQRQADYATAVQEYEVAQATRALALQELATLLSNSDHARVLTPERLSTAFPMPPFTHLKPPTKPIRIYASPYRRAQQTALQIAQVTHPHTLDSRESSFLSEKDFGLFAGNPETLLEQYPLLQELWRIKDRDKQHEGGKHYAPNPFGESDADVTMRVSHVIGTIMRDVRKSGILDFIVVSHGLTMRAFAKDFLHKNTTWIDETDNPKNCEIWLIAGNREQGYTLHTMYTGKRSELEALEPASRTFP